MKKTLALFLILASTQAFAATQFECYSRYYSDNKEEINVTGEVASATSVANVVVKVQGEEIYNDSSLTADDTYKPRNYKDYQKFELGENPNVQYDHALKPVDMLLPTNIATLASGDGFVGFVSDDNADESGSHGYYKILCEIQ